MYNDFALTWAGALRRVAPATAGRPVSRLFAVVRHHYPITAAYVAVCLVAVFLVAVLH